MNIFAYGTLMIPSLMSSVAGGLFPYKPAIVRDYARYKVKGKSYPALVPEENDETEGLIYFQVDKAALSRLDEFEGERYKRTPIEVYVVENGKAISAETYVLKPRYRHYLSAQPWDLATFKQKYLQEFLNQYEGFLRINPDRDINE